MAKLQGWGKKKPRKKKWRQTCSGPIMRWIGIARDVALIVLCVSLLGAWIAEKVQNFSRKWHRKRQREGWPETRGDPE